MCLDALFFTGLDINWEFPGLRGGRDSDKDNYDLFVQVRHDRLDFVRG